MNNNLTLHHNKRSLALNNIFTQTEIIWKTSIGCACAWELAKLSGSQHPFLAPLTLILCLQGSVHQSLNFAYGRVTGTVFGLLIIELFLRFFNLSTWSLLVLILIGTTAAKLIKANNIIIHQVALSILLVFAIQKEASGYSIDRLRDTVIGAAVAYIFILLIFPHNEIPKIKRAFEQHGEELAMLFTTVSVWIKEGLHEELGNGIQHNILKMLRQTQHSRHQFEQSLLDLKWNIYKKKSLVSMKHSTYEWERLIQGYMHALEITDVLKDWKNQQEISSEDEKQWTYITMGLSSYIKTWVHAVEKKEIESKQIQIETPTFSSHSVKKQQMVLLQETEWLTKKFRIPPVGS